MGIVSRTADLFYAFRFLKLLVTPWDKTEAYELGVIDDSGKVIKKAKDRKTPQEKSAYTVFHRLVFNVKRLMSKVPGGSSRLASYAAALFLIKENTDLNDAEIRDVLEQIFDDLETNVDLSENASWFERDGKLAPGSYTLTQEIASPTTGEIIGHINNKVKVLDFTEAYGSIFGLNIFQVEHVLTQQKILVTSTDIKR
jgi:hypothetical protein